MKEVRLPYDEYQSLLEENKKLKDGFAIKHVSYTYGNTGVLIMTKEKIESSAQEEIDVVINEFKRKIDNLKAEHAAEIKNLNIDFEAEKRDLKFEISQLKGELKGSKEDYRVLVDELRKAPEWVFKLFFSRRAYIYSH